MGFLLHSITENLKELRHLKKMYEDIGLLSEQNRQLSKSIAEQSIEVRLLQKEKDVLSEQVDQIIKENGTLMPQIKQMQKDNAERLSQMKQLQKENYSLRLKIQMLEEEDKSKSLQIRRNEERNARNHEKYTNAISSIRKQYNKILPFADEYMREREYEYNCSLPPALYRQEILDWYKRKTGKRLNLDHPQTINDKINWMKLYDTSPLKTRLADKYMVREWITEKIGEQYLIPLIGVWKDFDEIDFSIFPEQFVLKCTHGSGMNVKVDRWEDFDRSLARRKIKAWMNTNYAYTAGLEMHYKDIEPRIIAEQYLAADEKLLDFKFFCFHGKVEYIWVLYHDHFGKRFADFFDTEWNLQPFTSKYEAMEKELRCKKPENLPEMIAAAEKLAEGFSFVRVDLYDVESHIYFGEMTFTSGNGASQYLPEEYGLVLGKMI